jgi:hypothetical protein
MKTLIAICVLSIGMNAFANDIAGNLSVSTSYPTLWTTFHDLNFCKEEVKAVEPDAYEFIAGGELTQALSEVIQMIREEEASLKEASDLTIAAAIVESSEK